jgi:3-deoxy-manno-octulosonate cytidylyltransferase (CMP-KDO synthetase)
MAEVIGVIPARYGSTRFPGKPLTDIMGMTMIERVYRQASKASSLSRVVVATDDERIHGHVSAFGGEVMMTSPLHVSGTDRCAEVAATLGFDSGVVINIQGDEPFIEPKQIDLLVRLFESADVKIGTLVKRIASIEDLFSDTVIKVVRSVDGRALYFSRNPVPHVRGRQPEDSLDSHAFLKHIGIYAYRSETLLQLSQLPPSPLEKAEALEQLRWLEHGHLIHLAETDHESNSVDTPEDLARLLKTFGQMN